MLPIRRFVLLLSVLVLFGIAPVISAYAQASTPTPKPTLTPRPSRTPRPSPTPRPTATPRPTRTLKPTLRSAPALPLRPPEGFVVNEGTITLSYPVGWIALVYPSDGTVILASDPVALLLVSSQAGLESNQVVGQIVVLMPELLPQLGLRKTARPIDILNRIFIAARESADIVESRPSPENFSVSGKQGVATVYHCKHCTGYEYYMMVVQTKGGFAFATFTFKDTSIDAFRDTFRAVVASVEFTR